MSKYRIALTTFSMTLSCVAAITLQCREESDRRRCLLPRPRSIQLLLLFGNDEQESQTLHMTRLFLDPHSTK
jgi:hypothetical protein